MREKVYRYMYSWPVYLEGTILCFDTIYDIIFGWWVFCRKIKNNPYFMFILCFMLFPIFLEKQVPIVEGVILFIISLHGK